MRSISCCSTTTSNCLGFGKKTSRGRRFGFVSFLSTLKEYEICDSLNLIWFDSYKIRANPVRFQKDPERKKPDLVIKPQPQPKAMPKLTFRDSRTFVEALSDSKHPKKTVYYESIPDDKEWLLRSLVVSHVTRASRRSSTLECVMGDIYLVNMGRQGILCLLAVKKGMGVAT